MLNRLENSKLLKETMVAVKKEKTQTAIVLKYLTEIDRRRAYGELSISSLFSYCKKILHYSDAEAAIRVKAVRATKRVPKIQQEIENGSIGLSQAALLDTYFKTEGTANSKKIVIKLKNQSVRDSEKILAKESTVPEPIKSKKINLPNSILKKLQIIQNDFDDCSELEAIEALLDRYIEKKGEEKLKRVTKVKSKNIRYIDRDVKEFVNRRAKGQCEYINDKGERCSCRTNLQYDHILEISKGGLSTKDNVRKLCFTHNQLEAMKTFGIKKMNQFYSDAKVPRNR